MMMGILSDGNSSANSNGCDHDDHDPHQIHLKGVQAVDRDLKGITVDISYNLNVPKNWYDSFETTSPSYNDTMFSLHGENIWEGQHATKIRNRTKR